VTARIVTTGTESATPICCPMSNRLEAKARSLRGNHFETTLMFAGCTGASPMPRPIRKTIKLATPLANAVSAVQIDHQPTATG
jgi:hypothetical protein